ncbi:hypothetical protein CBER1_01735 [Cercospora berteroae]|uniref:Uncharacterized protein n=1 Tax=Cercospora berteroae TaxID=357750 RepID=A0A2S6CH77_9PEZI|nr:hypothetical protein CBER1_01735 [Cercospora berteroae]
METTDTIGRGWYGVIIVPKKQKDESLHDKAMRKAAKIIVQTRPDLAIGDFGKPARERDHKVAFVLDSSGNIVVPKKRKDETRGDKAARKAAEMAVNMQMANTVRIREAAASNGSQDHGVVDLAGDDWQYRRAEEAEGPPGGKADRSGENRQPRIAGKDWKGEWDSDGCVSARYGALPSLQFGSSRVGRPAIETMEKKCSDYGVSNFSGSWLWAKTANGSWVLTCHHCYNSRYQKRWRKIRTESRDHAAENKGSGMFDEEPPRGTVSGYETAQVKETALRDAEGEGNMLKKRKSETAEQRAVRKAAERASYSTMTAPAGVLLDVQEPKRDRTQEGSYLAAKQRKQESRNALVATARGGDEVELFGLGKFRARTWLPVRPEMASQVQECVECGNTQAQRYRWALRGRKTWLLICDTCYKRAWTAERRGQKAEKKKVDPYYGARSDYIFQGKLDNVPY